MSPPHRRRAMSTLSNAPSLNILGIATPAATPAILPDVDYLGTSPSNLSRSAPTPGFQTFNALRTNGLSAIPQSPHGLVPPGTGGSVIAGSVSPGVGEMRGDYFSSRRRPDTSPARESAPATTPGEKSEKDKSVKDVNVASSAPTPGLMGKLKGFGKKKEKESPMSVVKEDEVVKEEEKVSSIAAELTIAGSGRSRARARRRPIGDPGRCPVSPLPPAATLGGTTAGIPSEYRLAYLGRVEGRRCLGGNLSLKRRVHWQGYGGDRRQCAFMVAGLSVHQPDSDQGSCQIDIHSRARP